MSMPCAGMGVGMTCRSILRGAVAGGYSADLFTSRSDDDAAEPFMLRSFTPGFLTGFPHRITRHVSVRLLHSSYLGAVTPEHIAYLWPSVPRHVYETLHARGVPIVTDAINTRMVDAKPVMDAAYESLGLRPAHRITEARIADEEARLALTTAIFSPSPATDDSFSRSPVADRIIPSSYGTWLPQIVSERPAKPPGAPVTFLFVGLSCIRKGLHHLLTAWRDVPPDARLRIVGLNEPELRALFSDVLSMPNVSATSFSADVAAEYRQADVFVLPSLEEGDPIVVYEAAARGLPVVASLTGSGRIGAQTGAIHTLDTSDIEAFRATIANFTRSPELRRHWGERAAAASRQYHWNLVAAQRFGQLANFLKQPA